MFAPELFSLRAILDKDSDIRYGQISRYHQRGHCTVEVAVLIESLRPAGCAPCLERPEAAMRHTSEDPENPVRYAGTPLDTRNLPILMVGPPRDQ